MTALPKQRYTIEEYIELDKNSEERFEYFDGEVFAMAGASPDHVRISRNVCNKLSQRLEGRDCEAFPGDMRIKVPAAWPYRYPDVSAVCGEQIYETLQGVEMLVNPVLLVEVLSASTAAYDLDAKFTEYQAIESFREYLLIAQDRPHVIRYVRQTQGWLRTETDGLENEVTLESLGISLPLSEIYARVKFPSVPLPSHFSETKLMSYSKIRTVILSALVFATAAQTALAQDWTQWRGANRDGVVTNFTAPKTWPEQLKSKWKITVGTGHASPLVVGNRVYQHSRQGENEVVSAFDLETGKTLWQDSYPVAYTMNSAATGHGKGPKSTPVASGGKLYTLGITGVFSCYDLAKGKLAWRKDFGQRFGEKAPDFGTAMSPMVDRGLVILHAGGDTKGGLIALDAATGNEKWAWTQEGPSYASPIAVEIAGKRQIVTQSRQNIIGIWADNGGLLWKIPFDTEYVQNIVTPVVYNDLLIFSGINKGVFAVRVGWRDNKWGTDTVWHNKEVSMYMNSPVLSGNLLFGMSHKNKGQFFCLDMATGKTMWTGDPRQGENAAMLIAGNTIFSLTNDAELIVTSATNKAATTIKKYKVADSPTWAHPAISGKRILIKDENSLALLSLE